MYNTYRVAIMREYNNIELALDMKAPMTAMEMVGKFNKAIEIAFVKDAISYIEMDLLHKVYVKVRSKVCSAILAEYGRGC